MVKKTLVNELILDGAALLRELDRQDFPVDAMLWVELPERDYWRLVISTPKAALEGPLATYSNIGEVLREIGGAALDLAEISVYGPGSREFLELQSVAEHSGLLLSGPAWVVFNDAIVYRWNNVHVVAELDCDVSAARLAALWEDECQRTNLPRLLFGVNKRRVTIRFHPSHGPQIHGLANVKRPFQIALHRPAAFPGCRVKWSD